MAKKICPFCAEEIQGEAIKCKHCGEWLTKNSSSGSKSNKIPKGKPCHDKQCTGILNDEHVCGTCGRVYSQVQLDLREQRQEFPITTKNKKERSGMEQFFIFAVMLFGLLIFFTVIVKMQNTPTTTPQTKKHAATTQKKKVISPTQIKKQPAVDEKKLLKTDNYFGNYTKPVIKKESGTVQLKVWQPYLDYYQKLADMDPLFKVFIEGPHQLSIQYDEIWIHKNDADDITTLYWKNDKIQAYTLKKYYESNPKTHASVNAHQITSIYGRNSILTEIQK